MAAIVWDALGKRFYENGTDHGVLYPMTDQQTYGNGVAWNGLTGVSESPSGAEPTDLYADNIKYATLRSAESFGATISAYTYPDEFALCDGSVQIAKGAFAGQQERRAFGLVYRTNVGNDTSSAAIAYKLHLCYGLTASPSEKAYETVNDSPDAITFSWEVSSSPVAVAGYKPVSSLTIDSRIADAAKLKQLEDKLFGTATTEPTLVMPNEVITMLGAADAAFSVASL